MPVRIIESISFNDGAPVKINKDYKITTYVINMDQAKDRLLHIESGLGGLNIPFVRQPGVVGIDLHFPSENFSAWSYKYLHGRQWAPRELGCYLSHMECLKKFIASDADYALILEDDVSIHQDLVKLIDSAMDFRSEWNMLRLSTVNRGKWWSVRDLGNGSSLAVCLTREKGAGGYLVDRKAAMQMIKHLLPMRLAWDIAFDLEWLLGFKTLGIYPMPISQKSDFESQIQNDLQKIKIKGIFKYVTVMPFRTFIEISRLIYRVAVLVKMKLI
jgi:glycosyl transferase family 25